MPVGAMRVISPLWRRVARATQTPMFGVAVIIPLVFAGAVSAAAPRFHPRGPGVRGATITPVAAIALTPGDPSGPAVITMSRPLSRFHTAVPTFATPPPPVAVNSPGALGIPAMALAAYRNAERIMAASDPACGIGWSLLAGIGRIESMHANGGATDARGTAIRPIYGPALDGTLPGNAIVVQGNIGGRLVYARAMGPMQFLPGTWARYASDGDGDGIADPQNLFDSTLSAARYLCSGGLNLRDPSQVMAAILRYNNSMPYAQNVLGWAAAYATGVVPVNLPPLVGPVPPLGDLHLENPEGLGPALPLNVHGLPATDPIAQMPLIDLGSSPTVSQSPMWPWLPRPTPAPSCTLICIESQEPPTTPAPEGPPPAVGPPPDAPPPAPAGPASMSPGGTAPRAPTSAPPAGQSPGSQTPG
ncbi:MAG: lytic murein transglycosylase [Mycobacterium sp.]|uniref:lytic transglycosylase domain-containing protein n=1 Tax=Mycobacterium sp. TaxID=1785 RepID=UPI00262FCD9A|nr:lytic murein transglycosylase [Mycobacterium sp.]MDI3315484.1 lytic murein transglycosylase [Mycobacterium sp.]